jgi:hypothetical protein
MFSQEESGAAIQVTSCQTTQGEIAERITLVNKLYS